MNPAQKVTYMNQALVLAEGGRGRTSPNPLVGAVIVKGARIIGRGYHRHYGGPHAEVAAIKNARSNVRGSSMFVTLEPCNHYGKTPPCTELIVRSGIKKVYIGALDPNPKNKPEGLRALVGKGIDCEYGLLEDECLKQNKGYFHYFKKKRPFVTLKLAQSLDGKIAGTRGDSKWISSEKSRNFVQKIRRANDAILVGIETLLADDPLLSVRTKRGSLQNQPAKIILDSALRTPVRARVFSRKSAGEVIIFTSKDSSRIRAGRLQAKGAKIFRVTRRKYGLDVSRILKILADCGMRTLLVEGGGKIAGSFVDQKCVDEICLFTAPIIIGSEKAPSSISGRGARLIRDSIRVKTSEIIYDGGDIILQGRL